MTNTFKNDILINENEDYVQTANALFHFMKKEEYLYKALDNLSLIPRYCSEKVDYININVNDRLVRDISIIQKCFCDMHLHQLNATFKVVDEAGDEKYYTHTDFYGNYAIAFSKTWAEKNNLQPVHYVSPKSSYVQHFKEYFEHICAREPVSEKIVDDVLDRLTFLKPLQGYTIRESKEIKKNFHNENEWRYVPDSNILKSNNLERVIYKKLLPQEISMINDNLSHQKYQDIWLNFNLEDIRYLIVPTYQARDSLIRHIIDLDNACFVETERVCESKALLISKILVLSEIKKDY